MSEGARRQVAEEREIALHEYMVSFFHAVLTYRFSVLSDVLTLTFLFPVV